MAWKFEFKSPRIDRSYIKLDKPSVEDTTNQCPYFFALLFATIRFASFRHSNFREKFFLSSTLYPGLPCMSCLRTSIHIPKGIQKYQKHPKLPAQIGGSSAPCASTEEEKNCPAQPWQCIILRFGRFCPTQLPPSRSPGFSGFLSYLRIKSDKNTW